MSIFYKANKNLTNPTTTIPYLENDPAIIRGVTKALFDFSNPETLGETGILQGSSSEAGRTVIKDLTVQQYTAKVIPNNTNGKFPPVENGMIEAGGATYGGTVRNITLPLHGFYFDATAKRGLVIIHANLPVDGYSTSTMGGLIGCGISSTDFQYTFWVSSNEDGSFKNITLRVRGTSNIDAAITSKALQKLQANTKRQLAFSFDINDADGKATINVYMDGEIVGTTVTSSLSVMNQFDKGSATDTSCQLFGGISVGNLAGQTNETKLGRVSAHDLTSRPDLSFQDLLTKDAIAAEGYVY